MICTTVPICCPLPSLLAILYKLLLVQRRKMLDLQRRKDITQKNAMAKVCNALSQKYSDRLRFYENDRLYIIENLWQRGIFPYANIVKIPFRANASESYEHIVKHVLDGQTGRKLAAHTHGRELRARVQTVLAAIAVESRTPRLR